MTTAYKVVFCTSGLFPTRNRKESYGAPPGVSVKYAKGKWTKARKNSGLFVFGTLGAVNRFIALEMIGCFTFPYEIWECVCEDPMPTPDLILYHPEAQVARDFWVCEESKRTKFALRATPAGTLLFKRVKLIKQVTYQTRSIPTPGEPPTT